MAIAARPEAHPELDLERYRRELRGYCYRMLGSAFEADDAVQETMVRAWRSYDRFEGRSSLRRWLYRIATNVCLRTIDGRRRRALPMDLTESSPAATSVGAPRPEATWVEPMPDHRVVEASDDPAELAASRESIRLAFIAALQHLPPRQRAVLILRDVLRWRAAEVAELLETTVVSVNSALQRARESLASSGARRPDPAAGSTGFTGPTSEDQRRLLERYVDAFTRLDMDTLVSLLREDARMSMPPYDLWLDGSGEIARFFLGRGPECRSHLFVPAPDGNGSPAFGLYESSGEPFAIQVVDLDGDRISTITTFIEPRMFELFGLAGHLPAR
jgi:RNA polymerase sigma-70 factor (ECF subfamily)